MTERKTSAAHPRRVRKAPTHPGASPKPSTTRARERPQAAADDRATTGHGAKLEAVRQAVIAALLVQPTVAAAARHAGVGERTVRRWLAEDSFRAEYDKARDHCFREALTRIQVAGSRAVETLESLLDSKGQPAVRLGAARTLLDVAIHRHEMLLLLERVERLERLEADAAVDQPWGRR